MDKILIKKLKAHIKTYRTELDQVQSKEDKEDMQRIANIADSLLSALEINDFNLAKQKLAGFSRNVSDAYCTQPSSFIPLAQDINSIKSAIIK